MLFIVLGVAFLGDSMITVLIVPLVKMLMGGGAQLLGWLMMAQGIGGLLGGLLVGQFGKRFSPRRLSALGLVVTGIVILVIVEYSPFGMGAASHGGCRGGGFGLADKQ